MPYTDPSHVDIIAPNFKRRLSGVTSTIVQLVPVQNRLGQRVAVIGPGLPTSLPRIRKRDLWKLWLKPKGQKRRVWHARRNTEMLAGIVLRDVLRMPLKLLFTSAAQRHHTGYTRWLISKMDRVVATSGRSGSFLKVDHTVVMHGVDTELFKPAEIRPETEIADRFPGKRIAGCFGRVRAQKGTDLYVRAMIALLPKYPDWVAVISGRTTQQHQAFADELKAEIDKAGLSDRIVFIGEVDDIKPWFRSVSLCVAPSRNEGFGLTPLEAMASGAAVVASDAGAYAEMIEPEKTGLVVPAGDGEALRNAIEVFLADPQRTDAAGTAGRAHVTEHFELSREAGALGEIYKGLLEA
ncbi:glycosyltransferase family 4 protein [Rhizobium sp. L1K21]|uniref:glycosyltransferase family 4 protein n=1 Tax=Rhizobium sp. L1K21 TaxID=2954933 RepID=UPI00209393DF|nr:glycosyltransferase family 4 protein [Rhizobium sp. L1K21]MCO6185499.1 glycosyltransferase family 4 protein [Rhizobium sp. L1K21]